MRLLAVLVAVAISCFGCCGCVSDSDVRSAIGRRSLRGAPDCSTVHSACVKCANRRGGKARTQLVCTACAPDWRLRAGNPFVCDCAPGFFLNSTKPAACLACPRGSFCPGGKASGTLAVSCPAGLATIIPGAKSIMQCMTLPGFSRTVTSAEDGRLVSVEAAPCAIGSYNNGGNSMACTSCPPGLTTQQEGSTSPADCVAPPGSYLRNGVAAAKCPRGTYKSQFNRDPVCEPCGAALTTRGEGSMSITACRLAAPGYFLSLEIGGQELGDDPSAPPAMLFTAEPCPVDTFQDDENTADACKPCPNGLRTQQEGSAGVEQCMLPPGMELLPGASAPTDCPPGSYKSGWNMNACVKCGEGIETAQAGAVSADACFVPPGKGVVIMADGSAAAVPCVQGSYGSPEPNIDIKRARCLACPTAMATLDVLTGEPATSGYTSIEQCLNKPGWGMGQQSGESERCPVGSWSAGSHRLECTPCASGFTTLGEGAESEEACVVQAGWEMDESRGLPSPCQQGTYSPGGSLEHRFGGCIACPAGFTTQEDKATSADDCSVCSPGHGGEGCQPCPIGTFSPALSTDDCRPCPRGFTSAHGAASDAECLPSWPLATASAYSYLPLADESAWTDDPAGASSLVTCRKRCAATDGCMMFRYLYADAAVPSGSQRCMLLLALDSSSAGSSSRVAVGFKAFSAQGAAVDYAFSYLPEAATPGEAVAPNTAVSSIKECTDACTKLGDGCLLVHLTGSASGGYSCSLYKAVSDAEWLTEYRIAGEALLATTGTSSISTNG